MYSKTTLTTEFNRDEWLKVIDLPPAAEKSSFKFLYIGQNEEATQILFNSFQQGAIAKDFIRARQVIDRFIATGERSPDVIFIDQPLQKVELAQFYSFLQKKNILYKTLLVCTAKQFQKSNMALLHQYKYIDDVFDIAEGVNYSNKIAFLRRSKIQNTQFRAHRMNFESKATLKNGSDGIKRLLDVIIASLIILILLPVFLLIALAIKLESKGPVIYASLRAGKGFKVFKFYKFRTMEANADKKVQALAHLNQYSADGRVPVFFKITNDPRITKVGKFLRNTSLDELPQLFNVLKGDMSLVGNRPLPLYEATNLVTNDFVERFSAPAGMTGLWQIKKRGKADMSTEERIKLDISYARRSNILFDFLIIANTTKALLQKSDV